MGVISTGNITSGYSPFGRICSFVIIIKNLRSSARCYRLSLHRLHSLPGHGAAHAGLRYRLPLRIEPHHLSCRAGELVLFGGGGSGGLLGGSLGGLGGGVRCLCGAWRTLGPHRALFALWAFRALEAPHILPRLGVRTPEVHGVVLRGTHGVGVPGLPGRVSGLQLRQGAKPPLNHKGGPVRPRLALRADRPLLALRALDALNALFPLGALGGLAGILIRLGLRVPGPPG